MTESNNPTTAKKPRLSRGQAPLRLVPAGSWVALLVTWLIWIINAFDREVILRLGPVISDHFDLTPEAWGTITGSSYLSVG